MVNRSNQPILKAEHGSRHSTDTIRG